MSESMPGNVDKRSTIDGEHRIQYGLIQALCEASEVGRDPEAVGLILDRLIDYSRAHFMSEELLMRLDSYDGFDAHVDDHGRMLEALEGMQRDLAAGRAELLSGQARSMLAFLIRHIETRDAAYADWVPV